MAGPERRIHAPGTYFVTSRTWQSRRLFENEEVCEVFLEVLRQYRDQGHYALHAFVLMPEHFHLLITPTERVTLERAVQFIKGGASHRIRKERNMNFPVWQRGFSDHRIRDLYDYQTHMKYIDENPVKRKMIVSPHEYAWSSAAGRVCLDDIPQRLKPRLQAVAIGTAKAVP